MKVELHPAYFWDCDNCGCENMERGIEAELPDDVVEDIVNQDRLQPDAHLEAQSDYEHDDIQFAREMLQRLVLAPRSVTCSECNTQFDAELWNDQK